MEIGFPAPIPSDDGTGKSLRLPSWTSPAEEVAPGLDLMIVMEGKGAALEDGNKNGIHVAMKVEVGARARVREAGTVSGEDGGSSEEQSKSESKSNPKPKIHRKPKRPSRTATAPTIVSSCFLSSSTTVPPKL
ncbi:MAG: hypothetical protein M1831_006072 [Alyxoria varia]|nr:MAG: hypothetical protein M1831_006072 [Alyxoria varia]